MVALAPMPSPIESTAIAATAGCLASRRSLQPRQPAPLAISLPGLLRAAEANERLAPGFLGSESGADAVFGVHRHVAGEFGLEITVALRLAQEAAEAHP
jgi:hypothetical protein